MIECCGEIFLSKIRYNDHLYNIHNRRGESENTDNDFTIADFPDFLEIWGNGVSMVGDSFGDGDSIDWGNAIKELPGEEGAESDGATSTKIRTPGLHAWWTLGSGELREYA